MGSNPAEKSESRLSKKTYIFQNEHLSKISKSGFSAYPAESEANSKSIESSQARSAATRLTESADASCSQKSIRRLTTMNRVLNLKQFSSAQSEIFMALKLILMRPQGPRAASLTGPVLESEPTYQTKFNGTILRYSYTHSYS